MDLISLLSLISLLVCCTKATEASKSSSNSSVVGAYEEPLFEVVGLLEGNLSTSDLYCIMQSEHLICEVSKGAEADFVHISDILRHVDMSHKAFKNVLQTAAKSNCSLDVLELLVTMGAVAGENSEDGQGNALHALISWINVQNPSPRTLNGMTFSRSYTFCSADSSKFISKVFEPLCRRSRHCIDAQNDLKETPLHLAIKNQNFDEANTLISHGALGENADLSGKWAIQYASIRFLARTYRSLMAICEIDFKAALILLAHNDSTSVLSLLPLEVFLGELMPFLIELRTHVVAENPATASQVTLLLSRIFPMRVIKLIVALCFPVK